MLSSDLPLSLLILDVKLNFLELPVTKMTLSVSKSHKKVCLLVLSCDPCYKGACFIVLE